MPPDFSLQHTKKFVSVLLRINRAHTHIYVISFQYYPICTCMSQFWITAYRNVSLSLSLFLCPVSYKSSPHPCLCNTLFNIILSVLVCPSFVSILNNSEYSFYIHLQFVMRAAFLPFQYHYLDVTVLRTISE